MISVIAILLLTLGIEPVSSPWAKAMDQRGIPAYEMAVLQLPLGALEECGECGQGGCDSGFHYFLKWVIPQGSDRAYGEVTHDCDWGFCSVAHPPTCESDTFALADPINRDRLWNAAAAGSPDELLKVAEEVGAAISYNTDRQALQVAGCQGTVVLSLPLSVAQARSFSQ